MKRLHDLDAYLTGELTGAAADALEEAMFDAPDDADLAFFDRLARDGSILAAHGTFDMGVTRAHIDDLRRQGLAVQLLECGSAGADERTLLLDPTAQLIGTRLLLGRTDLERVDVELTLEAFDATKTIKDVFVDRSDGAIYGLCERALAETAWGMGITRVRVRERDGGRALVGEWTFRGEIAAR